MDKMIKAEKELVDEEIRMEKEVIGNPPSVQNIENVLKVQLYNRISRKRWIKRSVNSIL